MSHQVPHKQYVTEDGHVFLTQEDAEHHSDAMDLADKIRNEVGGIHDYAHEVRLAEWLMDTYGIKPE